jgi:hypothetical protein
MYIKEKKLTKGVSDQMNLPALLSASIGKMISFSPLMSDAKNATPKVVATKAFRSLLDSRRFIATLEANDTASRTKPVFVKYSSASSPSRSCEKIEVYASRTIEVLI